MVCIKTDSFLVGELFIAKSSFGNGKELKTTEHLNVSVYILGI